MDTSHDARDTGATQARGRPRIAAIVPALDEAASIAACLAPLLAEADRVIVADGGSTDATRETALAAGARVVVAPRGRARQMNEGAREVANADVFVFVHADTRLPSRWSEAIGAALAGGARWGRFDVALQSDRTMLRVVGAMMNLRSRLTGIATGDQAIFVAREAWRRAGGFADIGLMEDIDLSRRLKRAAGSPACLRERVAVSARRWERHGVWRTILQMSRLRIMYFFGASAERLHGIYYGPRS